MSFLSIPNVRIVGMSAGVPKNVVNNLHPADNDVVSKDYTPEDFVEMTGVEERRMSDKLTTSDLCYAAAEKLISDLQWEKTEIDALIFVTQTPDYIAPATSCIMQDRLNLSKECFAMDVSLGCSGWVYGLSTAASYCSSGSMKKVLLMVGDARPQAKRSDNPLFGYACTVTALEYKPGLSNFKFHFGTDGSGYDAIIVPDGGCRNQITSKSFELETVDGNLLHRLQSRMKGMDVFSFGISTAPKSVKKLAEHFDMDYLDADYFVFHQANKKMNETIVKKLKIPAEKVPGCMKKFGNTSSASIPLTMVTELKDTLVKDSLKFICCGFGIGLSWGTVYFETDGVIVSDLVEVDDSEAENKWL